MAHSSCIYRPHRHSQCTFPQPALAAGPVSCHPAAYAPGRGTYSCTSPAGALRELPPCPPPSLWGAWGAKPRCPSTATRRRREEATPSRARRAPCAAQYFAASTRQCQPAALANEARPLLRHCTQRREWLRSWGRGACIPSSWPRRYRGTCAHGPTWRMLWRRPAASALPHTPLTPHTAALSYLTSCHAPSLESTVCAARPRP